MEPSLISLPECLASVCCGPPVPCGSYFLPDETPRGFKVRLIGTDWYNAGDSPSVGAFCDPDCHYYDNREFYLRQCNPDFEPQHACRWITRFKSCTYYDTIGIGNPGYDGPHYAPYVDRRDFIIAGFFNTTGLPSGLHFGVYLAQNNNPALDCRTSGNIPSFTVTADALYIQYVPLDAFDVPIPQAHDFYDIAGHGPVFSSGHTPCFPSYNWWLFSSGPGILVDVEAVA